MALFRNSSLALLIAVGASLPALAQVNVTTYSGYTESSGGLTFSGVTGTQSWSSINSNANFPDYSWNAGNVFAADITSTLNVATAGTYTFDLSSDDGSYVFVDGVLIGDEPGAHSAYGTSFTDTLTAGNHSIEVQFYNQYCCGSGVELDLPTGLTLTSAVPEPGSQPMLFAGLGLVLFGVRRALRRHDEA